MRHDSLTSTLRRARRAGGLSQAALAAKSGAGRVTIARLEGSAAQDVRLGTLERLCDALGLELSALPRGALAAAETRVERERARAHGLDARRRHAALAARLLAASPKEAAALLRRARAGVDRWERDGLCSAHYITRWRERLAGSPRHAALALLEFDAWTDALLQNTPWSFALALPKP
jgi:transcriptional regulator with XRE-family HTH domain